MARPTMCWWSTILAASLSTARSLALAGTALKATSGPSWPATGTARRRSRRRWARISLGRRPRKIANRRTDLPTHPGTTHATRIRLEFNQARHHSEGHMLTGKSHLNKQLASITDAKIIGEAKHLYLDREIDNGAAPLL